jgi:hypothetical protein
METDEEMSEEDLVNLALESRKGSDNLSYFAFTATPKARTLELFGNLPDPDQPASKDNKPEAFHVYSMRQAMLGDFPKAVEDAVLASGIASSDLMNQYFSSQITKDKFARFILQLLGQTG